MSQTYWKRNSIDTIEYPPPPYSHPPPLPSAPPYSPSQQSQTNRVSSHKCPTIIYCAIICCIIACCMMQYTILYETHDARVMRIVMPYLCEQLYFRTTAPDNNFQPRIRSGEGEQYAYTIEEIEFFKECAGYPVCSTTRNSFCRRSV
jgi:hypothetical protein